MKNKEEQKTMNQLLGNVNRVEVIDENGRSYVNWNDDNAVQIDLQDDNRTLKIFIRKKDGK